jgi:hypothetical protein
MSEIWKDIPSAPGWMASSLGRIRSSQNVQMPNGGIKKLIVPATFGVFDPKKFRFKQSVFGKTKWVAPLICEAFNGPKTSPEMQCMHMDEDSKNNIPKNLEWGTKVENHHAPKYLEGRREFMSQWWGTQIERSSKLTSNQIREIRASSGSCAEVGSLFKITASNVSLIRRRKTWRHVP